MDANRGLTIYDVGIDAERPVTQYDLDVLQAVDRAYNRLREFAALNHTKLTAEIQTIRSRHGMPA